MTSILLLGLFTAMIVTGIVLYNTLIRHKNLVSEAWSGIDVQLKRRHDLIPNLVSVVEGYVKHERQTLEKVTALRGQLVSGAKDMNLENDLSRGIKSIFAIAENYPDLKANQNFLDLHKTLVVIEDELQMARRYYNGTVREYNIQVQSFPGVLVSQMFKFQPSEFFELEYATDRKNPDVRFN